MENKETYQEPGDGSRVSVRARDAVRGPPSTFFDEANGASCCRNGTSMISLIIPPRDQISRVSKMLADEFGTASNIKSRVNRLSVLGAITSVQHRLKLYTKGDSFALLPTT